MDNLILPRPEGDGIDRRHLLHCMAWVGTGLVWGMSGGLATSRVFGQAAASEEKPAFTFVQISYSHLGFSRDPNKDVAATLQLAVDRINVLPDRRAFVSWGS
jgi:hypothetical protein